MRGRHGRGGGRGGESFSQVLRRERDGRPRSRRRSRGVAVVVAAAAKKEKKPKGEKTASVSLADAFHVVAGRNPGTRRRERRRNAGRVRERTIVPAIATMTETMMAPPNTGARRTARGAAMPSATPGPPGIYSPLFVVVHFVLHSHNISLKTTRTRSISGREWEYGTML